MVFLCGRPECGAVAEVDYDIDPPMCMWYERRKCWWNNEPGLFLVTMHLSGWKEFRICQEMSQDYSSQVSLFESTHEQTYKDFTGAFIVDRIRELFGMPPLQEVEVEVEVEVAVDPEEYSLRPRIVCVQHVMSAVPTLVAPSQPSW